ncbi:MAG: hypothetical protein WDN75_15730 [Bacteroidota bacterium]
MNKIRTYEDLVAEKEDLERTLMIQKGIIRQDIADLKEELRPVTQAIRFISKITTKDKSNSLVTLGIDLVGDVLIKNLLLAKSGWAMRGDTSVLYQELFIQPHWQ